jgi:flavin-dependent dehydrogenase
MYKEISAVDLKKYEVVIIGAGPAGLKCAEVLGNAGKKVMLLEKNKEIGPKVCAGGLTRKSFRYLNLPPELIERKYQTTIWHSIYNKGTLKFGEDLIYTVDRHKLGQWQFRRLNNNFVTVRINSTATAITKEWVEINKSEKIRYEYLVGADGANSLVRKYLGLKTKFLGVGFQYIVPDKYDNLELFFDSKLFKCWYAWIFPYNDKTSIGSGYFPEFISGKKSRENFDLWLKKYNIDVSRGEFQAHPINCDYRGYKFGNVYLAGEAAGLAEGFSGEGIYPALISGEEIAKKILDPNYKCPKLKEALREIRLNNFLLVITWLFGPLRDYMFAFVTWACRNQKIARLLLRILT